MKKSLFADVLDAAGNLCADEREELVEILQKRSIEERRGELAKDIETARQEYKDRKYSASSAESIMKTILS